MDVKVVIGGRCAVEREWVGEGIRWSLRSLSVSPLQYGGWWKAKEGGTVAWIT